MLRQAAEHAAQAKVQLGIEYLNRFECYFLTTAADAVELVKAVNHPSFKTMYDTFHAHIEEKSQAGPIRTVAPCFGHVHISENDRGTPGTGQVRWDETFKALKEVEYDGWMVIEAFGRALPGPGRRHQGLARPVPDRQGGLHAGLENDQGEVGRRKENTSPQAQARTKAKPLLALRAGVEGHFSGDVFTSGSITPRRPKGDLALRQRQVT